MTSPDPYIPPSPPPDDYDQDMVDFINQYLENAEGRTVDAPIMEYRGSRIASPVMVIEHLGQVDGTDLFSGALDLYVRNEGTFGHGLRIEGEHTKGNLIRIINQPDPYGQDAFVVRGDYPGTERRVGINVGAVDILRGMLEIQIDQDDTTGLVIVPNSAETQRALEVYDYNEIVRLFVNSLGELFAGKNVYFYGDGVQVGSDVADFATFDGPTIGLTNLNDTAFTGAPTNGINIVSTDGHLRYVDQDGVVWRLPDGNPIPELHDLKSWSFDPTNATSNAECTQGIIYLAKVLFHRSVQASTIRFQVVTAASGPTNSYVGIYDLSGNLLTQSADISSQLTSTGTKSAAMVSPPVMPPKYYYVAFLCGATPGQGPRLAITGVPAQLGNANLSAPSFRFCQSGTGQTALPATIDLSLSTSTANQIWIGTA